LKTLTKKDVYILNLDGFKEWNSLNQEALDFFQQAKYNKAVVPAQMALEVAVRNESHVHVSGSLNNLAVIYKRVERIRELLMADLDYKKAHPYSLSYGLVANLSGSNQVFAYELKRITSTDQHIRFFGLGDLTKKEQIYKRAFTILEKHLLGQDEWADFNENALKLYLQGNYDQAISAAQKAPGNFRDSVDNLACIYKFQGDYSKAERLERRGALILRMVLRSGVEQSAKANTTSN